MSEAPATTQERRLSQRRDGRGLSTGAVHQSLLLVTNVYRRRIEALLTIVN